MTRRRSQTSAAAPARSENSMMGSELAAWTRATMSAEGAIEVISQEAPTPWMRLPKLETRLAVQMARKMRWRNGPSVEERRDPGLLIDSDPDGFVRNTPTLRRDRGLTAAACGGSEPGVSPPSKARSGLAKARFPAWFANIEYSEFPRQIWRVACSSRLTGSSQAPARYWASHDEERSVDGP